MTNLQFRGRPVDWKRVHRIAKGDKRIQRVPTQRNRTALSISHLEKLDLLFTRRTVTSPIPAFQDSTEKALFATKAYLTWAHSSQPCEHVPFLRNTPYHLQIRIGSEYNVPCSHLFIRKLRWVHGLLNLGLNTTAFRLLDTICSATSCLVRNAPHTVFKFVEHDLLWWKARYANLRGHLLRFFFACASSILPVSHPLRVMFESWSPDSRIVEYKLVITRLVYDVREAIGLKTPQTSLRIAEYTIHDLRSLGKHDEALRLCKRQVNDPQTSLFDTARFLALAMLCAFGMRSINQALEFGRQAFERFEMSTEADNYEAGSHFSFHEVYGVLLHKCHETESAILILKRGLDLVLKTRGPKHAYTLRCGVKLERMLQKEEMYEELTQLYTDYWFLFTAEGDFMPRDEFKSFDPDERNQEVVDPGLSFARRAVGDL